ncbi:MAG: tRNA threonylcarbamoyladenosine dehydratase [Clostridia bacterium]|nr:tRNA threonylcarbamoyladenosine dehydratase [Clostridia bacterium]
MDAFSRVKLLIGQDNFNVLKNSSVAVFGVGGVGGYAVEALARSGIGSITVFDNDIVDVTNVNRQIIATEDTVGKDKTAVILDRLLSINPEIKVYAEKVFYLPENADNYDLSKYDYIIDAVDTVSAKLEIISRAKAVGVPVISCMGTGGKLDMSALKVSDIEKTKGCPLARVMRRELKNRNIKGVKVVYSEESVVYGGNCTEKKADGKTAPPSMIFVPATAGLMLAREVVLDLVKGKGL